jgi:hypothetical protein
MGVERDKVVRNVEVYIVKLLRRDNDSLLNEKKK